MGDEVVKAKDGAGSATLSMAYAGAEFADKVMAGLSGEACITECTFVESSITEAKFFSSPVTLGKEGVEKIHDVIANDQKETDRRHDARSPCPGRERFQVCKGELGC